MRKAFMLSSILMALLLTGCSEKEVSKEQKAVAKVEDVETETPSETETTVEETETETETETEAEIVEVEPEVVTQETIDAFLQNYSDNKIIKENVYQTLEKNSPPGGGGYHLYTTWEFTPGSEEPSKIFEKKYDTESVSFGSWSSEVSKKFTIHDGYYVVEPTQTLTAESVPSMKEGYFPFSELRLGMTKEEAEKIATEPYFEDQNDSVFQANNLDVSYNYSKSSGLVTYLFVDAEVFTGSHKMDEIKALFGEPTDTIVDTGLNTTDYEYVFDNYTMFVSKKNSDEEWAQIVFANSN